MAASNQNKAMLARETSRLTKKWEQDMAAMKSECDLTVANIQRDGERAVAECQEQLSQQVAA